MQSAIQKNSNLLAVRDAAFQRLTRFANSRDSEIKQAYLFRNDKFAGVRFRVGAFIASWFCGDLEISIHRGANLIDQFPLKSVQRKAA